MASYNFLENSNIFDVPFAKKNAAGGRVLGNTIDPSLTDAELVKNFLGGNEDYFAALVERHAPGVYSFVYRYLGNADDANDITQEVFIRAWKHIKKFDTSRNFKTWIFAIAKNASLDLIKKKKPLLFSRIEEGENDIDAFLAPYVANDILPEEALAIADQGRDVRSALDTLSPAYRMVLILRYNEHLKFREIAEILKEPIDTIKSKHRRGLALLRKAFDVHGKE